MIARLEILILMAFQWMIVYVSGPFLLREPQDRVKLILRACAGGGAKHSLASSAYLLNEFFAPVSSEDTTTASSLAA